MGRPVLSASLLVAVLFLSSGASAEENHPPGLRVATFRCDVTLPRGHWLYRRPLATVEHRLQAKGIVLDDGRGRYVLCAVDWCTLRNSSHALFQSKLAAAAGTEAACVAIQCVHQHTAPSVDGDAQRLLDQQKDPPKRIDLEFLDEVTDRLAAAVKESLDRLQPVDRIGTGEAKVDRVASSRRIPIGDGKVRTRYSACTDPELRAEPEGYIDPMLKTVTLAAGDKPLVRLHYYATHPQSFYGDGRASIDTAGMARERLEKKEGVFQIYFTGCAGDVAMGKYNDRSPRARDELTDRLYTGMEASAASTRLVPVDGLRWRTAAVVFAPRTDAGYDPAENRAAMADPDKGDDARARAAGRVACAERLKQPIQLSLLQIGRVHILHLPGEPMVEFQLFAQQVVPDAFVAVAGYGIGTPGYLCTERAFDEGGYEPTASAVAPKSEKLLKQAIEGLLKVE